MEFCIDAQQLRRALKEIEQAEANGFHHCLAVFRMESVGRMLSDCRAEYSDMIERAHATDGNFNWGRFQGVSRRNRFVNGRLVLIEQPAENHEQSATRSPAALITSHLCATGRIEPWPIEACSGCFPQNLTTKATQHGMLEADVVVGREYIWMRDTPHAARVRVDEIAVTDERLRQGYIRELREWCDQGGQKPFPLGLAQAVENFLSRLAPEPAARLIEDEDGAPVSQAAHDVIAERSRQISKEGWTPEHDDQHKDRSMALAAACYAMFASVSDAQRKSTDFPASLTTSGKTLRGWSAWLDIWPWDRMWWKPKDRRADLVRAGALILAEIERLDRLSATKAGDPA